ncbi:hypothetical protein [Arsenophonus nasoniae]|uniref:Uncharacterized protein n=1 Tax=Arsenophonus nasoniae TaxID=638 RepID=A0AA95GGC8_9GAMM|nr:hypothetical protein [Arsenophonus nasoniae]WGL95875.1 hypothetical protein QE207_04595 [Arsenophonus nasoniae]
MTIYNELPEDVRPYVTDFKEKEQAYQQARQSFAQKEHDVELIKNRKAETQKALKEYDTQWRQLFHENKGEMTKQMKALRTECVLAKETLEEFNNLIAVAEKDITPYQWQLGEAASQLIDAQHKLIARYATCLFNHFMQEQGKVLNAIMRFYYYSLSVNEVGVLRRNPRFFRPPKLSPVEQLYAVSAQLTIRGYVAVQRLSCYPQLLA